MEFNGLKIIAVIPVFGRRELVKHTIERFLKKNGCYKVICAGHLLEDQRVCEDSGAQWVQFPNKPLGAKWNEGFKAAGKHSPDGCLFVGSGNWLSENWFSVMTPYLKDYDLVGTPGCHLLHIGNDFKLCYWPGYAGPRKAESIGIGRIISRRVLERLHWEPFDKNLDSGMDGSMTRRCLGVQGKIHIVRSDEIQSVGMSTDWWENKHKFLNHYNSLLQHKLLPSVRINNAAAWVEKNFPEAIQVCASLKGTSVSR